MRGFYKWKSKSFSIGSCDKASAGSIYLFQIFITYTHAYYAIGDSSYNSKPFGYHLINAMPRFPKNREMNREKIITDEIYMNPRVRYFFG